MPLKDYPDPDPQLPEIPGIELAFDPTLVNCWAAWRDHHCDERPVVRSPWKKLTWKLAKKYMEAMG